MSLVIASIKLYNVNELAKDLKLTPPTVRRYFHEGILKGRKIGTKYYITEENLKKYLEGGKDNG
jgi:excisionase family DNA binding protein